MPGIIAHGHSHTTILPNHVVGNWARKPPSWPPLARAPITNAALICPSCHGENTFDVSDGDTLPLGAALPAVASTADGLALNCGRYAFHATLNVGTCENCKAEEYLVMLSLVNRRDLSFEWADKYFWCNEDITEPSCLFTVTCAFPPAGDLPTAWYSEQIPTEAGLLERHCFGPDRPAQRLPTGRAGFRTARGRTARRAHTDRRAAGGRLDT